MATAAIIDRNVPAIAGLQNFASDGDRKRLTGTAVKAVLRLVDKWSGSNAEGAALLGVSESTWDRMKSGKWEGTLSQDQLTRASALIGIFKALNLLFAGKPLNNTWVSLRYGNIQLVDTNTGLTIDEKVVNAPNGSQL